MTKAVQYCTHYKSINFWGNFYILEMQTASGQNTKANTWKSEVHEPPLDQNFPYSLCAPRASAPRSSRCCQARDA